MEKQFYIYIHCRPDGTPFYVGKGSGKRAYVFYGRNKYHSSIVNLYKKERIGVFIFNCKSESDAFENEIHVISQFVRDGYKLANITTGGEGVCGLKKTVSSETRNILSIKLSGNKNALGYKHSEEELKKMSDSSKKRKNNREMMMNLKEKNSKKVMCIDTGEIFMSSLDAAKRFEIKYKSSITKCCRGITKTAYGKLFSYI